MTDVFISYSCKDKDFVRRLHVRLDQGPIAASPSSGPRGCTNRRRSKCLT